MIWKLTYARLDVDFLQLFRDGEGELWGLFFLEKDSERSGNTFETEEIVSVGRDFDL